MALRGISCPLHAVTKESAATGAPSFGFRVQIKTIPGPHPPPSMIRVAQSSTNKSLRKLNACNKNKVLASAGAASGFRGLSETLNSLSACQTLVLVPQESTFLCMHRFDQHESTWLPKTHLGWLFGVSKLKAFTWKGKKVFTSSGICQSFTKGAVEGERSRRKGDGKKSTKTS